MEVHSFGYEQGSEGAMMTAEAIVSIVVGIFAVIAGLYNFVRWARTASSNSPTLSVDEVITYESQQRSILEVWRLFDFRQDIRLVDVYVQEILEIANPVGRAKAFSPPVPEDEVRTLLSNSCHSGKRLYIVEGNAGSGKSTMLRGWALRFMDAQVKTRNAPTAIYLALRHLPSGTGIQQSIRTEDLSACFQATIPSLTADLVRRPFERLETLRTMSARRSKRVLVLLGRAIMFPFKAFTLGPLWRLTGPLVTTAELWLAKRAKNRPEWVFLCDGLDELKVSYADWRRSRNLALEEDPDCRHGSVGDKVPNVRETERDAIDRHFAQLQELKQAFGEDSSLLDSLAATLKVDRAIGDGASASRLLQKGDEELVDEAVRLRRQDDYEGALRSLSHCTGKSRAIANARAVCFLRLEQWSHAAEALGEFVLDEKTRRLRFEEPVELLVNWVTAILFAERDVSWCRWLLDQMDQDNRHVHALTTAIDEWRTSLTLAERLKLALGVQVRRVQIPPPLGIEWVQIPDRSHAALRSC